MRMLAFGVWVLFLAGAAIAITPEEITEAQSLINANTSCSSLTNSQLEIIGEFLMEQMHPGAAHDFMHQMMGLKDGSVEETQFHINLAKAMYCGDSANYGMMGSGVRTNMMRGMMGYGNYVSGYGSGPGYGYGMMGNYNNGNGSYFGRNIFEILLAVLLVGLIASVYLSVWNKATEKKRVKR